MTRTKIINYLMCVFHLGHSDIPLNSLPFANSSARINRPEDALSHIEYRLKAAESEGNELLRRDAFLRDPYVETFGGCLIPQLIILCRLGPATVQSIQQRLRRAVDFDTGNPDVGSRTIQGLRRVLRPVSQVQGD